jgi:hypothetical protein
VNYALCIKNCAINVNLGVAGVAGVGVFLFSYIVVLVIETHKKQVARLMAGYLNVDDSVE